LALPGLSDPLGLFRRVVGGIYDCWLKLEVHLYEKNRCKRSRAIIIIICPASHYS
ncbi:hypothetical protein S83_052969, partial [Arachis hypogaea]